MNASIPIRDPEERIAELLEANNRYQQEARDARVNASGLRNALTWMLERDAKNGSLPDAYRCKILGALAAKAAP